MIAVVAVVVVAAVRIGRVDTKFYFNKPEPEAWSSIDIIDVNVNPIGHFFCDFMGACH